MWHYIGEISDGKAVAYRNDRKTNVNGGKPASYVDAGQQLLKLNKNADTSKKQLNNIFKIRYDYDLEQPKSDYRKIPKSLKKLISGNLMQPQDGRWLLC